VVNIWWWKHYTWNSLSNHYHTCSIQFNCWNVFKAYLPSNPFSSGHTRKSSLSPSFPWTPVGTRISLRWPGIGPDIRNIYLFGKYRDFTYRKDNNVWHCYKQRHRFFRLAGEEQAGPSSSSSFGIPDKDLFFPVDILQKWFNFCGKDILFLQS
jgi:hypothetical protein